MSGALPLSETEIETVIKHLNTPRDKCLFILGINTGFRLSELLSVQVKDVYKNNQVVDRLKIDRCHIKAKTQGRDVPLNRYARYAIQQLFIARPDYSIDNYLFKSRNGENHHITRDMAHKILSKAFMKANLTVGYSSHSMRKTFAHWLYGVSGHDIIVVQHALGHTDIATTRKYLGLDKARADELIFNK